MKLIICEKPSQAKQVRSAVGNEYTVVSAVGHLFRLELNTDKEWSLEKLPIFPTQDSLKNSQIKNYKLPKETKDVYTTIANELDKKPTEIICGTDPDFEGEAIYRTIIEYYQLQGGTVVGNQKRLILKDTTAEGIKEQMNLLEPIESYDGWKERAYGRAYADYLLGINGTQALTLNAGGSGNLISIGRVQTPTLKLIVDRYKQFKKHEKSYTYGLLFNYDNFILSSKKQRFNTKIESENLIKTIGQKHLTKVATREKYLKPPKLHNLSTLQKIMNKKHKLKSSVVLDTLQSLYDKQFTSYPRTDCQLLTSKTADGLKNTIVNNLESIKAYMPNFSPVNGFEYNKQIVGDVSAHEGITITNKMPNMNELSKNELVVYEEIVLTCCCNFMYDLHVYEEEISITVGEFEYKKKFNKNLSAENNEITWANVASSYVDVDFSFEKSYLELNDTEVTYLINTKEYESKPPKLFNEGTLLDAMKNAGKSTDSKDIFKDIGGIGTPATRSSIIETLYKRKYIVEEKNNLLPTKKGIQIINLLQRINNPLVDIEYTAVLESQLRELENGRDFDIFINTIKSLCTSIIDSANTCTEKLDNGQVSLGSCPKCKNKVIAIKSKHGKFYGCTTKDCDFVISGGFKLSDKDVIDVLSGKKSSVKNLISKNGKSYKVKFKLVNKKVEMEFYNSKNSKKK